ncbi:ribosome hibernation-promoting factor, HPF/YfiA family [Asticcacaulis solisilvae]|uniref:ribosome hibernation-promoting factor, HPF/YfiA family n=1 Tax=Asticcacaulis solisilvae TaxID=1217274 RepID=UPI003FD78C3E
MQIQVNGKQVEVGDALRERVLSETEGSIAKYFDRGGTTAEVTFSKQGYLFKADCWVRLASGQSVVSHAFGGDAHTAFDVMLDHLEKRVRRYKQRLKQHHNGTPAKEETANVTVLRSPDGDGNADLDELDDGMDHSSPPQAMIIAETEQPLRTMTVSAAVAELELSNYPVVMFRNAAHGGLSVLYRRPDGNIGWIDPERTAPGAVAGNGKMNGKASHMVQAAQ